MASKTKAPAQKVSLGFWEYERDTVNFAVFVQPNPNNPKRSLSYYLPLPVFEQMGEPQRIRLEAAVA